RAMPSPSTRSSVEVASNPRRQNNSIARSTATSMSNVLGLPMRRPYQLGTDRSTTVPTCSSGSGDGQHPRERGGDPDVLGALEPFAEEDPGEADGDDGVQGAEYGGDAHQAERGRRGVERVGRDDEGADRGDDGQVAPRYGDAVAAEGDDGDEDRHRGEAGR